MSLHLEKKITRRIWDNTPMSDTVMARVNELAKVEPEHLIFADRKGQFIGDAKIIGVYTSGNQEPQKNFPVIYS